MTEQEMEAIKARALNFWWNKHSILLRQHVKNMSIGIMSREEIILNYISINHDPIANNFFIELVEKIKTELDK